MGGFRDILELCGVWLPKSAVRDPPTAYADLLGAEGMYVGLHGGEGQLGDLLGGEGMYVDLKGA